MIITFRHQVSIILSGSSCRACVLSRNHVDCSTITDMKNCTWYISVLMPMNMVITVSVSIILYSAPYINPLRCCNPLIAIGARRLGSHHYQVGYNVVLQLFQSTLVVQLMDTGHVPILHTHSLLQYNYPLHSFIDFSLFLIALTLSAYTTEKPNSILMILYGVIRSPHYSSYT